MKPMIIFFRKSIQLAGILALLGSIPLLHAQNTGTGSLTLTVSPEATVSTTTSPFSTSTSFSDYTATQTLNIRLRTTSTGGAGTISAYVSTDFSAGGSGNPSVNAPPTGDTLKYTCGAVPSIGSGCVGNPTATTASGSATSVATFGQNAHTAQNTPATLAIIYTLTNDPIYPTGSYTATITYTISVT